MLSSGLAFFGFSNEWVQTHSFYLIRMVTRVWSSQETVRRAWADFAEPVGNLGYEIIELEFTGGPGGMHILRVYIDKPGGGIGLDDCTAVSQALNPVLDREDYIGENYYLEVSSPGIDRPLRRPEDFARFVGEPVRVTTHAPVDGSKRFRGVLEALREDMVVVSVDGVPHDIHLENVKKANLDR